jgi:hypothetical protein
LYTAADVLDSLRDALKAKTAERDALNAKCERMEAELLKMESKTWSKTNCIHGEPIDCVCVKCGRLIGTVAYGNDERFMSEYELKVKHRAALTESEQP